MMVECVGIYCLICLITGKRYVGSSFRCRMRGFAHFGKLTKGKHINKHLQSAWDKYGADQFTFEILEVCERHELKAKEQEWINHFKSGKNKYGFNLMPAVRQDTPAEGISKIHKEYWAGLTSDESAERHAYKRTNDGRALLRQNAINLWADPEYRQNMTDKVSATMKEYCKKPEVVELRTKSSRDYWAKPSSKKKMSERMARQWAQLTPEERSKRGSHVKPRETTKFVTLKGVTKPLKEWSVLSGLGYGLLLRRLNANVPPDQLFSATYKHQPKPDFVKDWL